MAIQDSTFLNIFTAYISIPGLDDGDTVLSALIVGVVAAVYVILNTVKNRRERAKKGYRQNSAAADYLKAVIIAALILAYCYMLSQYRGISVMLVWVVAICLIYNFITAKTAFGRYFYAVGGNEKATQLSGINTNKIYFIAYANMGLLAGLCGLLNAARVGSVNWTPSAPASSAARPPTAAAAPSAAWSSALCCWASSTWACPSWASATPGSMWSRAACCSWPSSSTWSPAASPARADPSFRKSVRRLTRPARRGILYQTGRRAALRSEEESYYAVYRN